MSKDSESFPFGKFPRGNLALGVSRRGFLTALKTEVLVLGGKNEGGLAFKLSELGSWSDQELSEVIPQIKPGSVIQVQDGYVLGYHPETAREKFVSKPLILFPLDSPALYAYNLMNGFTTLDQVSSRLADETGWDTIQSFAYVRGLFLWLVWLGICVPRY